MATISEKYIGNHKIHTSPRGARYIITDDGRKLYINTYDDFYTALYHDRLNPQPQNEQQLLSPTD